MGEKEKSLEERKVIALEQIADSLESIRVHLFDNSDQIFVSAEVWQADED